VNRLSLTLGLAAMNVCWIAPWAALLGPWTDLSHPHTLLSAPSVFALLVVAALSTQALGRHAARTRLARVGLLGLGVVAVLLVVRVDQYPDARGLEWVVQTVAALAALIGHLSGVAFAFVLALLIWWRGVRLGSQMPTSADVEGAFRWGIGSLVVFALVVAATTRRTPLASLEAETTPYVVGFFFVSLLTLALARLESLRTRTRALGVNGQWLSVLVSAAGLIVLVALLIAQIMSFDVLIVATRPLFDLLGLIILAVLYVVLIPLAYIVEFLVFAVLSLLRLDSQRQPPDPMQPSDVDEMLRRIFALYIPPEVILALKAAGAVLLLALGLMLVARALARWRPARVEDEAAEEERDSVFDRARLWNALRAWLGSLFGRSAQSAVGLSSGAEAVLVGQDVRGASVRELYRRLLRRGEDGGAHRAAATTPLEHLPALRNVLEPDDDVAALTDAYIEARYAERTAVEAEIDTLRARLDAVRPKSSGTG
jgi:hypothetical protein